MSLSSARRSVAPLVGALVGALLVSSCTAAPEPGALAPAAPTSVSELDPGAMEVPRIDFCDLVGDDAVRAALDAEPDVAAARSPGDPVGPGSTLGPGDQPAQELGCAWSAGTTTARAWVFARPVGEELARSVVEQAEQRRGCRATPASYGAPSVRQVCTLDGLQRTRYAGRFGDTWLSCELEAARPEPAAAASARAEAWCVAVAGALDADS